MKFTGKFKLPLSLTLTSHRFFLTLLFNVLIPLLPTLYLSLSLLQIMKPKYRSLSYPCLLPKSHSCGSNLHYQVPDCVNTKVQVREPANQFNSPSATLAHTMGIGEGEWSSSWVFDSQPSLYGYWLYILSFSRNMSPQ